MRRLVIGAVIEVGLRNRGSEGTDRVRGDCESTPGPKRPRQREQRRQIELIKHSVLSDGQRVRMEARSNVPSDESS